jgi:hypothetical protein
MTTDHLSSTYCHGLSEPRAIDKWFDTDSVKNQNERGQWAVFCACKLDCTEQITPLLVCATRDEAIKFATTHSDLCFGYGCASVYDIDATIRHAADRSAFRKQWITTRSQGKDSLPNEEC